MEGMCPAWQFPDGVKFIYASYVSFASAGFFGPYYSLMNVFTMELMVRRVGVFML